jgi:hypothetical protein
MPLYHLNGTPDYEVIYGARKGSAPRQVSLGEAIALRAIAALIWLGVVALVGSAVYALLLLIRFLTH